MASLKVFFCWQFAISRTRKRAVNKIYEFYDEYVMALWQTLGGGALDELWERAQRAGGAPGQRASALGGRRRQTQGADPGGGLEGRARGADPGGGDRGKLEPIMGLCKFLGASRCGRRGK